MRFFMVLCLCAFGLHAGVYYAKVEPRETYAYKAAYAGVVSFSNKALEGKNGDGEVMFRIDDSLDRFELEHATQKKTSLVQTATLIKQSIANTQKIVSFKEANFARLKELKTKSLIEKENEQIALLNAKNQLIALEQSYHTTQVQIADLSSLIAGLNDKIAKKSIAIPKTHLVYKIHLNEGEYASMGASLVDAYDMTQGKLTFFIAPEDSALAQKGVVYLDGQKSELRVHKIWSVADTQNISAYRCEILLPKTERFSHLVKIEFREH